MANPMFSVKVDPAIHSNLEIMKRSFITNSRRAVDASTKNTAKDIQNRFKGDGRGFRDRTGALRRSIKGGFVKFVGNDTARGQVGAGDSSPGSEGIPTEAYASIVEFGVSSPDRNSYLRPGVLENIPSIFRTMKFFLSRVSSDIKAARLTGLK